MIKLALVPTLPVSLANVPGLPAAVPGGGCSAAMRIAAMSLRPVPVTPDCLLPLVDHRGTRTRLGGGSGPGPSTEAQVRPPSAMRLQTASRLWSRPSVAVRSPATLSRCAATWRCWSAATSSGTALALPSHVQRPRLIPSWPPLRILMAAGRPALGRRRLDLVSLSARRSSAKGWSQAPVRLP